METASKPANKPKSGWLNLLIDYGPVVVFFIVYRMNRPAEAGGIGEVFAVTQSTIAFIVATIVALFVSRWKLGRVSPMLWLSTVLVIGFGALTVWLQDPFWIRHKPTAVYLLFGAVLLIGWWQGRAMLQILLESAFDGLDQEGWMKLSRNWGLFFLVLAAINEVLANPDWFTFEQWLQAKLIVFLPLSFLFTFAHMPMLLRHGLAREDEVDAVAETPHE